MKTKTLLANLLLPFVTGCGAYQLSPLPLDHPANAEARTAPQQPASHTLAYTSADAPAPVAATAQSASYDAHRSVNSGQTADGRGKVVATVPGTNQLVIDHEAIKGVMEAMTMGYPVDPPSLLDGLKPGDSIRFTIDIPKKTIVKVEKLK